jgi:hypothetical protein
MQDIKVIAPKAYMAVQAMIDGIRAQKRRKKTFTLQMATFGYRNSMMRMCFGCAATCALQKLANKNFVDDQIQTVLSRAEFLGFDRDQTEAFEEVINHLRCGSILHLLEFYYPENRSESLGKLEIAITIQSEMDTSTRSYCLSSNLDPYGKDFSKLLTNFNRLVKRLKYHDL